jgi:hypothetical protein
VLYTTTTTTAAPKCTAIKPDLVDILLNNFGANYNDHNNNKNMYVSKSDLIDILLNNFGANNNDRNNNKNMYVSKSDLIDILLDDSGAEALGGVQRAAVRPLGLVPLLAERHLDAHRPEHLGREDRRYAAEGNGDTLKTGNPLKIHLNGQQIEKSQFGSQ